MEVVPTGALIAVSATLSPVVAVPAACSENELFPLPKPIPIPIPIAGMAVRSSEVRREGVGGVEIERFADANNHVDLRPARAGRVRV